MHSLVTALSELAVLVLHQGREMRAKGEEEEGDEGADNSRKKAGLQHMSMDF